MALGARRAETVRRITAEGEMAIDGRCLGPMGRVLGNFVGRASPEMICRCPSSDSEATVLKKDGLVREYKIDTSVLETRKRTVVSYCLTRVHPRKLL